ncbi:MAG: DUF6683 family protein [Myxococcaceae bacterium]|nr:DUF6683 family protein [Myxococcaceae bacterium]
MKPWNVSLTCIAALVLGTTARAQPSLTAPMYAVESGKRAENLSQRIAKDEVMRRVGKAVARGEGAALVGQPPAWKLSLKATDYTPTGKRAVVSALAESLPAGQRAEFMTAATGLQKDAEALLPRKNNLAVAAGTLVMAALNVVRPRDYPDAQVNLVMKAINDALGSMSGWKQVSDEAKTDAADLFVVTAMLLATSSEQAKLTKDPAQKQQAEALAKTVLTSFGVEL